MTRRMQFLLFLCTLALMIGMATMGARAHAQQSQQPGTYPAQQPPGESTQPPNGPQTQMQPMPGQAQTFTGIVTKQGNQYVLKDQSSGKTYELDHQDLVKKYEGKRVRVKGTLDPDGKTIHIQ
jgi:Protein of unknown function (DUF5818)